MKGIVVGIFEIILEGKVERIFEGIIEGMVDNMVDKGEKRSHYILSSNHLFHYYILNNH